MINTVTTSLDKWRYPVQIDWGGTPQVLDKFGLRPDMGDPSNGFSLMAGIVVFEDCYDLTSCKENKAKCYSTTAGGPTSL